MLQVNIRKSDGSHFTINEICTTIPSRKLQEMGVLEHCDGDGASTREMVSSILNYIEAPDHIRKAAAEAYKMGVELSEVDDIKKLPEAMFNFGLNAGLFLQALQYPIPANEAIDLLGSRNKSNKNTQKKSHMVVRSIARKQAWREWNILTPDRSLDSMAVHIREWLLEQYPRSHELHKGIPVSPNPPNDTDPSPTIKKWLKDVAPEHLKPKRGRPRKNK